MDTGNGNFEMLKAQNEELAEKKVALEKKYPNHGGWFHEGELIEIRGSLFKVAKVQPTKLTLKLQRRPIQD